MIKFFTKQLNNKKGFTLIELIVVIAILGILAAIAIPRFTASRKTAEQSSVEANLRTIDSAIMVYLAEKGDSTPPTSPTESTNSNLVTDYLAAWPKGPGEAKYAITTAVPYRATVSTTSGKTVGGREFGTPTSIEDIVW